MGWGTPSLRPHQRMMDGWLRKRRTTSRALARKERHVLGLDVVVLGGGPEVVPDHHAVLVGELVENLFGVLADPVADDVDVGFAVEAEEGFEVLAADALAGVVHAPVAAARGDADAVDLDDEVGEAGLVGDGDDGGGGLGGEGEGRGPVLGGLAHGLVADVDEIDAGGAGGIDLGAAEVAGVVEERELVGDLADAEGEGLAVGLARPFG